jgi:hypothetical protein
MGWPQQGMPQQRPSSRRWVWVVVAAVAVLAVLVVGALFVVGKKVTPTNSTPAAATFTDPANHFSATYQSKPVEEDRNTTVSGRSITEVLWTNTIDANTAEIIGYANFPPDFTVVTPNAALDGSVTGEVTNTHGTLLSKTFSTFQGFHSVDAVISASGGYIETRTVLAGRTLYVLVVTSLNNPPELFSGFANSLHILNHAA